MRPLHILAGLAVVCLFFSTCTLVKPTPAPRDLIPFHRGIPGKLPLVRVVLLPLHSEDTDSSAAELFGASLRNAITKRNVFEVVQVHEEDLAAMDFVLTREKGVYRTADLILMSQRFGADGVIFGTISRFRAFPAVQLGARLSLVDCRIGDLRWSTDFFLDAADAAVDQDVHNFHDVSLRDEHVNGHHTVLVSPRLFCNYAAARTADTLERVIRLDHVAR